MSDESPLFVSSLELIAHATELFAQKDPRKYKFVILHLANAVELILKDHVIDLGMSIYEAKTTKTIGIWDCTSRLAEKGIEFPEIPVLQLLIDDRNNIQHRFGHPTAEATYYYIKQVVNFFQRFLNEHYNIQLFEALKSYLSEENLKLLGLVQSVSTDLEAVEKLANVSIESSILQAYKVIERDLAEYIADHSHSLPSLLTIWNSPYLKPLLNDLRQQGYLTTNTGNAYNDFMFLRRARNQAAHNPEDNAYDWQKAFMIAKEMLAGLQKAKNSGYKFTPPSESKETE